MPSRESLLRCLNLGTQGGAAASELSVNLPGDTLGKIICPGSGVQHARMWK